MRTWQEIRLSWHPGPVRVALRGGEAQRLAMATVLMREEARSMNQTSKGADHGKR